MENREPLRSAEAYQDFIQEESIPFEEWAQANIIELCVMSVKTKYRSHLCLPESLKRSFSRLIFVRSISSMCTMLRLSLSSIFVILNSLSTLPSAMAFITLY